MAERWQDALWAKDMWWRGKTSRRRFLGLSATAAGAVGATLLVPAPWREAFGQAKPYKIGTMQPLTGAAAAGGITALVGTQMAVDRINKSGGLNGRPVELLIGDYESKPDVGRRKAEKLVLEDKIDAHAGGYLSNVCLACMPVWDEAKIVNMIGVCLDTTITTSKCSRYTFRPFDYAPAQAVAFAPYLVNKLGKKWFIGYADYSWGQSTKDAYSEQIKKAGGEVVGTIGIPLGTADMTAFLSKITGSFDGLFGIFFGLMELVPYIGPILGAILLFAIQTTFTQGGPWYLVGLGATAALFALVLPRGLWGAIEERFGLRLMPVGYRVVSPEKKSEASA